MIRLVLSEVNTPVENVDMTIAHKSAGHQRRSHRMLQHQLTSRKVA